MLVFNSSSARALAKEKQVHNHYNWKTYGLVNNVVNRNEKNLTLETPIIVILLVHLLKILSVC